MTTVLAILGSARHWSNSEVLAREALGGAQEAGANRLQLLRLSDLHLEPCTGCLRCVLADGSCPLDDDIAFLFEQVAEADALVVAGPTYFLGPTALIKQVMDRILMLAGDAGWAKAPLKPAAALAVSGLESWRGVTAPFLNALAMGLGGRLVGWMAAYAPGPGEVLLQPDVLARARDLGRRLVSGEPTPAESATCPVCGADFFRIEGPRVTCPLCGQTATLKPANGGFAIAYDPPDPEGRWTKPGLYKHVQEWVIPTGARFLAHRQEVKAERARYDGLPIEWVRPPERASHGG
jgi:NAD(P)H-dependent FMN reductase